MGAILILAKFIEVPFIELIETLFPMLLILIAYQGFYGSCVFLYSKWENQLKANSDNRSIEPIMNGPEIP